MIHSMILAHGFIAKKTVGIVMAVGVLAIALDPTVLAAALVMVISALATAVVLIIKALTAAKRELMEAAATVAEKSEAASKRLTEKAEAIVTTAAVIKGHVDGMTTLATAKRDANEETITSLRQQLALSEQRAVALAAAAAATTTPQAPRPSDDPGAHDRRAADTDREPLKVEVVNVPLTVTATEPKPQRLKE